MDSVWLTFWVSMAVLIGFGAAYIANWHLGAAVAALSSFVAVGMGLQVPGGVAVGLAYLAVFVAIGLGAGKNVVFALTLVATALAVTAFSNASHVPEGACAAVALFLAVGTGCGADAKRRMLGVAIAD